LVIAPLHWNLHKLAGTGVLTGAELSSAELGGERNGNGVEGVGDGVMLLHKQEGDMRKRFGHQVGDEQHGGEELTIDGGRRMRVPMWMMEETVDDGATWGQTTA
jgi:hypothetical protein